MYVISLEQQSVSYCQEKLSRLVQRKFNLDYIPILTKEYINQKRYCILTFHLKETKISFCVIFRKQKFHAFGTIYKGKSEDGETINQSDYEIVKQKDVKLLIYHYSINNEIEYLPLEYLEKNKEDIFEHINKADGKKEWAFSCNLTKNLGEWILV
jgi:hypothetical protein